ncbi:MAG: hypothetical protein ACTXOO_01155 [Sodalis sp. (in: enterobacteria)]
MALLLLSQFVHWQKATLTVVVTISLAVAMPLRFHFLQLLNFTH